MSRPLSTLISIAVAAALLVAVGCGGDGDGSDPLSKAEFIAAADRICAEGDAAIDAEARAFSEQNIEDVEGVVDTVIAPGLRDEIEQLRQLTPPESDQSAVDEFIDTLEKGVDQLEANPVSLASGLPAKTVRQARLLARAYGMESCDRGV